MVDGIKAVTEADEVFGDGNENPLLQEEGRPIVERRRSGSLPPTNLTPSRKTRRKTSSESETIANIAAMVQETTNEKKEGTEEAQENSKSISVSVIKTKENVIATNCGQEEEEKVKETASAPVVMQTPAQRKATEANSFVEVSYMFLTRLSCI